MKNILLKVMFYGGYDPEEALWLRMLRLVPALCFIAALMIHFIFVRGNL